MSVGKPDSRAEGGVDPVFHDLWHAVRALRRSPGVTLSAIMVLGVGIGATVAIFSVVYPVVLTPLRCGGSTRR